jgi:DNA-binding PadR family transcriptional regulator
MPQHLDPRYEAELRRGAIQLVALHFLEEPRYGYDLVRLLGSVGFPVEEGTLYPILRRFEKQGVLTSRWDTDGARPRKYYELSEDGRARKAAMREAWQRARDATDEALDGPMKGEGEGAGEASGPVEDRA